MPSADVNAAGYPYGQNIVLTLGALPEGASSVCVTPLDSFGTPGRPLVASICSA